MYLVKSFKMAFLPIFSLVFKFLNIVPNENMQFHKKCPSPEYKNSKKYKRMFFYMFFQNELLNLFHTFQIKKYLTP